MDKLKSNLLDFGSIPDIDKVKELLLVPHQNDFLDGRCFSIRVENSIIETLNTIKNHGGFWANMPDSKAFIFIPWPLAAILAIPENKE